MPVIMTVASAITAPHDPITTLRHRQNSQNDGSRTVREPGRLTPKLSLRALSAAIRGGGSWMNGSARAPSASAIAPITANASRHPKAE